MPTKRKRCNECGRKIKPKLYTKAQLKKQKRPTAKRSARRSRIVPASPRLGELPQIDLGTMLVAAIGMFLLSRIDGGQDALRRVIMEGMSGNPFAPTTDDTTPVDKLSWPDRIGE